MMNFDELKKRIDLVEYAQRQGWEIDSSKSTKKATVLDKLVNGRSQDTIVVYKGADHDYFYTPNHSKEKGDVIAFERFKNNSEWKDIGEKLNRYVGEVPQPRQAVSARVERHSHNEAFEHNFNFQPLTNTNYLESRGISRETAYSDEFQNRIFNRTFSLKGHVDRVISGIEESARLSDQQKQTVHQIALEKNYSKPFIDELKQVRQFTKENNQLPDNFPNSLKNVNGIKAPEGATDRTIVNTSFPLRNENNVIAAINRNEDYNRIEMPKANAVWTSRTNFDKRPVSHVVIQESPIDSLSYHQLNPPSANEKRLYIATAGQMANDTPVLIERLIKESQAKKVVLANDNDLGGIKQNINLVGQLNLTKESEEIHARLNVHQRTDGRLVMTINHHNEQEGKQRINELTNRITSAINRDIPPGVEKEAKATVIHAGDKVSEVEISFHANRQNLIRVEKALVLERGLEQQIEVKRPIEKDYNEDLKRATPYILAVQEKTGREQIVGRYAKELDAQQALIEKSQEKPDAKSMSVHMEINDQQDAKRVPLAQFDTEKQEVIATPEFSKQVERQKLEQQRVQAIQEASNKQGDIKMVDGDGNTVAATNYTVEVDKTGKTTIHKEQRFDQEELAREGTSGKTMQDQMNREVSTATNKGTGRGSVDGADLKDTRKDLDQQQSERKGLSM